MASAAHAHQQNINTREIWVTRAIHLTFRTLSFLFRTFLFSPKMPKRKLEDADDEDNSWQTAAGGSAKIVDPEKKKHSLDSDEEESDEDDQHYHILSNDDITGIFC